MEFELYGQLYRADKIDALSQFHIVRRLAPIMGKVAPLFNGGGGDSLGVLEPLADAIGALSDEDSNHVLFGLLKAIKRKDQNGLGWSPVSNGASLMYEDINMSQMLQLAFHAFKVNFSDFFPVLPLGSNAEPQLQSAPSNG
jgi:hypothetical protein